MWLKVAGSHAEVRWQESHEAVVITWFAVLPRALEPLWQLAQVPGATRAWLKVAGSQAVVRWQESHEAVVTTWLAGLPFALEPLWQEAQEPAAIATWLKRAPAKVDVLWQDSQGCVTGMWFAGMTTLAILLAAVWHEAHCLGVPLNTPRTWHESQRVA